MVWIRCKMAMTPTVTQPSCHGLSNGSVSMHITGETPPYSWSWTRSNPSGGPVSGTDTVLTGLSAGTYSITITGGSGCSGTFTFLVVDPALLTITADTTNITCFGGSGTIDVTALGGTAPYTYNWADLPGTNDPADRMGLAAGTYSVTVTDSKGCTASTNAVISGPSGALAISETHQDITCFGYHNGSIDITVTGGTPPYTYHWNDGVTSQDRNGLAATHYLVVVKDAKLCEASIGVDILEPEDLFISVNKGMTCDTGFIDVTVTGGTSPYTYDWADLTPPPTEPLDRHGISQGTYTITVTDSKNCIKTLQVELLRTSYPPCDPEDINHY